jgi:hypothetical protein
MLYDVLIFNYDKLENRKANDEIHANRR